MYIATFYTHYGAQTFHKMQKSIDSKAELMPVPRALSASCGICVMFELDNIAELIAEQPEDLEGLYLHDEDGYKLLHEGNEY
ncbi:MULTISPECIES: DUF3343 domain-containing protein [Mogibacterium]|nr:MULTISPECIES: DUF3343 domain-containing protein [Mogibacterium]NWO22763.1 DUF3343 domain-containing protein [Mogibacterium timidum]